MIQPLHDYLTVKVIDEDSSIVKTRDVRDDIMGRKGEVLAVGPGIHDHGDFIVPVVKEGDVVYWEEAAEANTPQSLRDEGIALVKYARLTAKIVEEKK